MLRRVFTAVVAIGLLMTAASAAQGASWTWDTRDSPLNVYSNGNSGTLLGQAHGTSTVTGRSVEGYWNVDWRDTGYLRDRQPGGNSIYTDYSVQVLPTTHALMQEQSQRWDGSSWTSFAVSDYVIVGARDREVSIKVQVCEDRRLAGDPCNFRLRRMSF